MTMPDDLNQDAPAPNTSEIDSLKLELASLTTERDSLKTANLAWADQENVWTAQGEVLQTAQADLVSVRLERDTLKSQLDQSNATLETVKEEALSNRRSTLRTKYKLSEERVASLDNASLDVLEAVLAEAMPIATPAPPLNPVGLDLSNAPGNAEPPELDDMQRARLNMEEARKRPERYSSTV